MKKSKRYDTSHLIEDQFEPGSNGQVLKNKLGITSPEEMDDAEAIALKEATDKLVRKFDKHYRFTAADICGFHKIWLDGICTAAANGKSPLLTFTCRYLPAHSYISLNQIL